MNINNDIRIYKDGNIIFNDTIENFIKEFRYTNKVAKAQITAWCSLFLNANVEFGIIKGHRAPSLTPNCKPTMSHKSISKEFDDLQSIINHMESLRKITYIKIYNNIKQWK